MSKVLLVSMPFGAMERPALGLSLLKARLEAAHVDGDVRYLTFAFAEYIGHDTYQWMTYHLPYTAFAGDWTFTAALYGEHPDLDRAYQQNILRDTWRLPRQDIDRILHVRSFVPALPRLLPGRRPVARYAVVGFTSTFEQNIASLALARRLKAAIRLAIAFGGANWEAVMGRELHRAFPFVDYVCSGEADLSVAGARRGPRPAAGAPARRCNGCPDWCFGSTGRSVTPARPRRSKTSTPAAFRCSTTTSTRASQRSAAARVAADAAVRGFARLLVGGEVALHVLRPERARDGVPQQESGAPARRDRLADPALAVSDPRGRRQHPRHELLRRACCRRSSGARGRCSSSSR